MSNLVDALLEAVKRVIVNRAATMEQEPGVCERECVCARESERVCARESVCEREHECVCVREREGACGRGTVSERARHSKGSLSIALPPWNRSQVRVCVSVCVCAR